MIRRLATYACTMTFATPWLGRKRVAFVPVYRSNFAVDRPVYYATQRAPNQHVAYRGTNGHVYELLW